MTRIPSWLAACRDSSAITAQSQTFHLWVATFPKDTIGGGLWWGSFYQVEIQKMTKLTPDFRGFRVEKLRKLCIFDLFQCLGIFSSLVSKRHNCKDYLAETPDVQSRLLFPYCGGGPSDATLVLGASTSVFVMLLIGKSHIEIEDLEKH
jgi:hypothetical protein